MHFSLRPKLPKVVSREQYFCKLFSLRTENSALKNVRTLLHLKEWPMCINILKVLRRSSVINLKNLLWVPTVARGVEKPASIHEDAGWIPGLTQWVKGSGIVLSCCVGRRCSLDPVLLCLWYGPAAAALIRPLTWKRLYAVCYRCGPPKENKQTNGKRIQL